VLANVDRLSGAYDSAAAVFAVSDSKDDSAALLADWAYGKSDRKILDLGNLVDRLPQRTARLAHVRNLCLQEALTRVDAETDHLIVVDLDDVLTAPIDVDAFRRAAEWLDADPRRAGVFANSAPSYYDIWPLRHETWCPEDCWHAIWGRLPAESFETAKLREVYCRQIRLPVSLPPIRVQSAFGGLGIYKAGFVRAACYSAVEREGMEVSEHVAFNAAITAAGGELHIFPPLLVRAPQQHLYDPALYSVRTQLIMHRFAMDDLRRPHWRQLVAPSRRAA
jgi:hypothetical protein